MKARELEKWGEAFDHARQAVVEQSTAEARLIEIEGIGSVPYTPYLLLGLAAHHRADCKITTQAYVGAVAQRIAPVLAPADFALLREGREACADAGDAAQLAAADAVADALVAQSHTRALRDGDLRTHWDSDPRWQATFEEATRGLEFGHNLLVLSAQGTGATEDLQSATAVALRSNAQFREIDKLVGDAAVRNANTAISTAWDRSDDVDTMRREAAASWSANPDLAADTESAVGLLEEAEAALGQALGRRRTSQALLAARLAADAEASLRTVLRSAESLDSGSPRRNTETATTTPALAGESSRPPERAGDSPAAEPEKGATRQPGSESTTASPGDSLDAARVSGAAQPSTQLRAAATTYFRGDYQGTLDLLQGFSDTAEARIQAHLLRAAADFALSRLERSEQRLQEARAEIGSLLELDPSFRPPADYFSPAFLQLFER